MKVFISWSGERSKRIANGLKSWLKDVVQVLDPWVSSQDISVGGRWAEELGEQLHEANCGVLCLTPENQLEPWIVFEAGALSKSIESGRVIPYRFQLSAEDVLPPLSQFQGVDADREGTRALIESLNAAAGAPLPQAKLKRAFERWWPDMEAELGSIDQAPPQSIKRTEKEYLEEILALVQRQSEAAVLLNAADAVRPGAAQQAKDQQAREIASQVSAAAAPRVAKRLTESSILWVDDRPSNNDYEREALEALGIRFTLATSTEEALERLSERDFDAIISDMGRPPDKKAGFTLLGELKKMGPFPPFIIYAGSSSAKHHAETKSRGGFGTTNRPRELFKLVLSALQRLDA